MTTLTRSSPELEPELDKLAVLVYCSQHDAGDPKVSRIEDWIVAFPIGDDDTEPVVSVEKQIRKALGRIPVQCIGITSKEKPCKMKIGGQKVQNCVKTIDEIVQPEFDVDDVYLNGLLKVLETNMYCHFHMNKQPL